MKVLKRNLADRSRKQKLVMKFMKKPYEIVGITQKGSYYLKDN